jgi:hypothetical protein
MSATGHEQPSRVRSNTRACLQTHHGPAPLLDPALSESRVRATLQTRPSGRRSFIKFSSWLPAGLAVGEKYSLHNYCRTTNTYHQHPILLAEDLVVDIHAHHSIGPKLLGLLHDLLKGNIPRIS